jgi:hypothetical protein
MPDHAVRGDLRERVDGGFEGWCWAPDRPEARLVVDLLVDDSLATSIVAAIFRRDLQLRGIGDGRHGFKLRLPPNLPQTNREHIVTARERGSGVVFGRVLRHAVGALPGAKRLDEMSEAVDELWFRLEAARALVDAPSAVTRLRGSLGVLARRLSNRRGIGDPPRVAAAIIAAKRPPILLPELVAPTLTVVLRATDAEATWRCLAALAPAAARAGAEFIVVDPGADPEAALLPARVENLRYVRDTVATTLAAAANFAAASARGTSLVLLDGTAPTPSAAALLTLARLMSMGAPAVLLGSGPCATLARLGEIPPPEVARLDRRLGLVACVSRTLWPDIGPFDPALTDGTGLECADLALRARLLGLDVRGLAEPHGNGMPAVPMAPAEMRRAVALFAARWGHATLETPA